jgi:hypothetical protein
MIGNRLNIAIVGDFEKSFRINCLSLIGNAYRYLIQNKQITVDFDEEQISANIFVHIDDSSERAGFDIHISDECRQYCNEILSGKKRAKNSPRIDLKFSKNWVSQKNTVRFFVEAKNLIENNCHKAGRKTPIDANVWHKRYIKTGIDNFTNGTYPQPGCILGYVLEGCPSAIVGKINSLLCNDSRNSEQLNVIRGCNANLSHCYQSRHPNSLHLEHYWLDFM